MFLGDRLNMFVSIMILLNLIFLPATLSVPSGLTDIVNFIDTTLAVIRDALNGGVPDTCGNVSMPVCAGTQNGRAQTFDNECKLNKYVSMFPSWSKSRDGPCDCGACSNTISPVCYLNGNDVSKNIQFVNECYYKRYICLHGVLSVGFKQNNGRCQICQKPIKYDHPSDPQWADYYKNNVAWINFVEKCVDDSSPLVAE